MAKLTGYVFVILTVINFFSILALYYVYHYKILEQDSEQQQAISSRHAAASKSRSMVIVDTTYGRLAGAKQKYQNREIVSYLGVPYAQPPIGELKFRPPLVP